MHGGARHGTRAGGYPPALHYEMMVPMTKGALIPTELEHLAVPITDVKLWPKNPRRGDVGALSESLKRFGQVRPILVQKSTMQVVAGNHLLRAAAALGWTEIAALILDMSDKQAKAYVAADNRMSELGDFDEVALASLLAEIVRNDTLEGTGYDKDDLDALLAKVGSETKHGFGDPDAQPPLPETPWVRPGQMFALGPHRVICGDGYDTAVLDRLLGDAKPDLLTVTPPKAFGPSKTLTYARDRSIPEQFWFSADKYDLTGLLSPGAGSWMVWDKQSDAVEGQFGDAFELIWSAAEHRRDILRYTFIGAADGEKYGGPDFNERPTSLYMHLYERFSTFESVVLDPFAQGATALLAAERVGRVYYGCKLDPAHVQRLLEKWKDYADQDAEEIGEATN